MPSFWELQPTPRHSARVFAFGCPGQIQLCADGAEPGSIIQASDGNLYGLSSSTDGYHSTMIGSWYNGGALWKINPSNNQLTLLFWFTEATTGFWPDGTQPKSLVEGPDGYLYGGASGGSNAYSAGLIFKVSKTGSNFQVVQTYWTSCTNGGFPNTLTGGTDGNLYGATSSGGYFQGSAEEACPQGLED